MVLVVHSLSPATEDGEDDDLGDSCSGDMKYLKEELAQEGARFA